jgi:hypothetical protein
MKKDGLFTIVRLLIHVCRIYDRYSSKLLLAIANSGLSPGDQALMVAAVASITAACVVLRKLANSEEL